MIRKASVLVAILANLAYAKLGAQDSDAVAARGAAIYEASCVYCHDRVPEGSALEMLPGPASLALKYGGALSPYIKERPDLANFNVLQVFLRNGAGSMPPFRKTEITDEDIAAVAAYFARTSSNLRADDSN
jgi:mono/diheme cytochrome c family protein